MAATKKSTKIPNFTPGGPKNDILSKAKQINNIKGKNVPYTPTYQ